MLEFWLLKNTRTMYKLWGLHWIWSLDVQMAMLECAWFLVVFCLYCIASKIQLRSFHLLAIIKVVGSPLLIDPMCLNWVGAYSMGLTRVTTLHGLWCHLHCMLISNKCNYNFFFQRITFDIFVIIVQ